LQNQKFITTRKRGKSNPRGRGERERERVRGGRRGERKGKGLPLVR